MEALPMMLSRLQNFVSDMIESFDAVDISKHPNFYIRKDICDQLCAQGWPKEQAQTLVGKMTIEVSEEAYEEVGKEMMDKLIASMVGVLIRYNNESIKAGLGPVTSGELMNLKLG
jgi:hypothetical protein